MNTQLTVRVSLEMAEKLQKVAQRLGVRKSDVARIAIREYLAEEEQVGETRPYERVRRLIGAVSSGIPDLGERHREYLVQQLRKHA